MAAQDEGGRGPRGLERLAPAVREELAAGLSPSELTSVLLDVARARAGGVTPSRVLERWTGDRFVRPSAHDPRRLAALEARLWALVPGTVAGVELSPVAPLGTCAAVAGVDQHRIVSTVRGTEVVSDPTNALAVEAAHRRRVGPPGARVDLAACHRVLRAQRFPPGHPAHFRLFAVVSSARDTGSARTEAALLLDHLTLWRRVLAALLPGRRTWVTVSSFADGPVRERVADTVLPALAASPSPVAVREDPDRTRAAGYYRDLAVAAWAEHDGEAVELGDGGFTTWTAALLTDRKERCLVSCLATERLADLAPAAP